MAVVFPKDKLVIEVDHFPVVLNYQRRMARCAPVQVESETTGPYPMRFVCDQPGRYVGNGKSIMWTISGKRRA